MEKLSKEAEKILMERFGKEENTNLAQKMKEVFSEWIDNGHTNFSDVNTCILRINLIDGLLISHGTRYEIGFSK